MTVSTQNFANGSTDRGGIGRWCWIYVVASCCANIGQGLVTTVVGPTQPYLAANVDVDIDTINFVWSFGFAGYFLGALVAGFVFRRYFDSARGKVGFVGGTAAASGLLMCILPFIRNFGLLAVVRVSQYIALVRKKKKPFYTVFSLSRCTVCMYTGCIHHCGRVHAGVHNGPLPLPSLH